MELHRVMRIQSVKSDCEGHSEGHGVDTDKGENDTQYPLIPDNEMEP
jgi:hypothetical protein